jgi:hypothetical protein
VPDVEYLETDDMPPGFYAFGYAWDADEGGWGDSGYWDGRGWDEETERNDLPAYIWYGPFETAEEAEKRAETLGF